MLGVGKSNRVLLVAVTLAVLAHSSLLLITLDDYDLTQIENQTLSISLVKEDPKPPPEPKQAQTEKLQINPVQIEEVTAAQQDDDLVDEAKTRIQTSLMSNAFKSFVQRETDNYRNANPDSVEEFSTTFDETITNYENIPLQTKRGLAQARATGVFMIQNKNGGRTCGASVPQLLSGSGHDDGSTEMFLGKDCTPEKKFELNLNKPNNGWMDR